MVLYLLLSLVVVQGCLKVLDVGQILWVEVVVHVFDLELNHLVLGPEDSLTSLGDVGDFFALKGDGLGLGLVTNHWGRISFCKNV